MDDYTISFTRSARKEIEALHVSLVNRIFPKIEKLSDEPRPKGCHKLKGEKNLWRIRIGDYRVIYTVHDKERIIDIITVRHRRDAYGKLK